MTTIDCSTINNETLAHLVIINQMAATTGCTHEQAKKLLISTEWRLDVRFFFLFSFNKIKYFLFRQQLIYYLMNEQCQFLVANFLK
jgi:hypothetical protein